MGGGDRSGAHGVSAALQGDRRLGARLLAARAVLWAEALGVALWPVAALLAAFAGLALLGVFTVLPWPVHAGLLLATLAGLAVLLVRASPAFRAPGPHAAERRLERDSGLRHRPFATLRDRPADDCGTALWALHQARMRAGLDALRLRPPTPDLPNHDRMALRGAAVLLLVAGLAVAGPRAGSLLRAAMLPGLPGLQEGAAPTVQAWIEPPAYTGLPPVFLPASAPNDSPITVPSSSRLTLSVGGLTSLPSLSLAGRAIKLDRLSADSFQATLLLTTPGRLRLDGRWSALAGWTLALLPNEPPAVAWTAPPGRAGTSPSTRLAWQAAQRWGVARLEAVLVPSGSPGLPARHIPLPLPGTPRHASGQATPDLSADPYAGVKMSALLAATDVSGQHAEGAAQDFILPAREFHHPLARAIADLRRRLALHPDRTGQIAEELTTLAEAPLEKTAYGVSPSGAAVNLSAASTLLRAPRGPSPDDVARVQARLWELALALDGALPDASARALAEAQDKLRHGIEEHARGKLSDKDLSRQLDALRQALDKRLADLAQRAQQHGALQKFDPHSQHLSAPSLDRLIQKLDQALREGRTDEARRLMSQLERTMEQLKNAHIMTPEEARQQREQARTGRQQMGAVQDMVQRESKLLDHAQARGGAPMPQPSLPPSLSDALGQLNQPQDGSQDPGDQQPFAALPPVAQPDPGTGQQTPKPGAPPRADDARTQRALHRAVGALKDGLAQSGRKPPPSLDDAARAMQDAAQALASSDDPMARDATARAIAALQQGGQDMARQGGQQSGAGMQLTLEQGSGAGGQGQGQEDEDGSGDGESGGKRDPFGRPVDGNGAVADDPNLRVPDGMEQGRSRAIQEELRRRGADRGRPKGELDYIDRLLKPF